MVVPSVMVTVPAAPTPPPKTAVYPEALFHAASAASLLQFAFDVLHVPGPSAGAPGVLPLASHVAVAARAEGGIHMPAARAAAQNNVEK
jgi:hypothetical protein